MFERFFHYSRKVGGNLENAYTAAAKTVVDVTKTAYSLGGLAVQCGTGVVAFDWLAGKACTFAGFGGCIPISGSIGAAINSATKIAFKVICNNPTAALVGTIVAANVFYPEKLIKTGENLYNTAGHALETYMKWQAL